MITVVFKGEDIYARESGLWQHDRGQKLRIEGLDISEVTEIDFSLKSTGGQSIPAVAMPRNGGIEVDIPNSLLAAKEVQSYFIYAFIYLIDGESGETIRRITMDVRARPGRIVEDPEGDPDPFAEAIKEVRDSAARAESAAVTANEAIVAVETKGTEQANIVAAEGKKQLDEIARVMATIPEDYTQLDQHVQDLDSALNTKAPAIRLEANVQNGVPTELPTPGDSGLQGLTVYGKSTQVTTTGAQMIPYNLLHDVVTNKGITYTRQEDGSFKRTGAAESETGDIWIAGWFSSDTTDPNYRVILTLPPGTYTIKHCRIYKVVKPGEVLGYNGTFTLDEETDFFGIRNEPFIVGTTYNDIVYPMLNKGESALPFEPYTGGIPAPNPNYPQEIESVGEEVGITSVNQNLFDVNDIIAYVPAIYSLADDDWIVAKVPPRSSDNVVKYYDYHTNVSKMLNPNTEYRFIVEVKYNPKNVPITFMSDNESNPSQFKDKSVKAASSLAATVTTKDNFNKSVSMIRTFCSDVPNITEPATVIFRISVVTDLTATVENYKYTPHKTNSQILPTPNGLPGIPVTSGGNYTAPDGQQWVCDTIEWDRASGTGEYVKRVSNMVINDKVTNPLLNPLTHTAEIQFTLPKDAYDSSGCLRDPCISNRFRYIASSTWNNDTIGIMSVGGAKKTLVTFRIPIDADEQYFVNNPTAVQYILATPIRTPLTADQIKALESLHTFSPTSIISNDQGADMQVIYAADTKAYIDSKIDALSKTILDAIGGK